MGKVAVVIASGLGNAITLVPAINAIRRQGHSVTGFFTSEHGCEHLFRDSDVFTDIKLLTSKAAIVRYGLTHRGQFDWILLDQFANTRRHEWLAKHIAQNKIVQKQPEELKHMSLLMMDLLSPITGDDKSLDYTFLAKPESRNYVIFQPSSGNNITPWKNWGLEGWLSIVERLESRVIVIGDQKEVDLIPKIESKGLSNLDLEIGTKSISEMVELVNGASLYIGHDSGPMHIAAACSVPTFTVWGGSDPLLYGYENVIPGQHKVVRHHRDCHPCDSWAAPNTSRTDHPANCPDFACIREIGTEEVLSELKQFLQDIGSEITIK